MKKSLIIGLGAAAVIAGTASMVKVDSSKPAPAAVISEAAADESEAPPVVLRNAQVNLAQVFDYQRGPRIIQVPQNVPQHRRVASRAVVDDDDDIAPPPRPRVVTPKPRVASAPPVERAPRWKPRKEVPAEPATPPLPRRAVLSAPPPSNGPTPLRPTPRFDNQAADAGIKFAPPPPVTEAQPPLGYSPPATPEAMPADETQSAPE